MTNGGKQGNKSEQQGAKGGKREGKRLKCKWREEHGQNAERQRAKECGSGSTVSWKREGKGKKR